MRQPVPELAPWVGADTMGPMGTSLDPLRKMFFATQQIVVAPAMSIVGGPRPLSFMLPTDLTVICPCVGFLLWNYVERWFVPCVILFVDGLCTVLQLLTTLQLPFECAVLDV